MWWLQLYDVLFLHWRTAEATLQPVIPPKLQLDRINGDVWVSLVLFRMQIHSAMFPFVKLQFYEVNFRTYVRYREWTGIWFFSVHANHYFGVTTAKLVTPIPYQYVPIRYKDRGLVKRAEAVCNQNCRIRFLVEFIVGPEACAAESFPIGLVERSHLFTEDRHQRLLLGMFRHPPWSLQPVRILKCHFQAAPLDSGEFPSTPDLVHFSPGTAGDFGAFRVLED